MQSNTAISPPIDSDCGSAGPRFDFDDDLLVHIDSCDISATGFVTLRGWIACRFDCVLQEIKGQAAPPVLIPRPDVEQQFTDRCTAVGFEAKVGFSAISTGCARFVCIYEGQGHIVLAPLKMCDEDQKRMKREKLAKIKDSLVCPHCRGSLRQLTDSDLGCTLCAGQFSCSSEWFNFLPGNLAAQYGVVDTVNVSANKYDSLARSIIGAFADGLVADCGAGFREEFYPNVINIEIAKYPSTDVLAVNERLPFADNTFDAVLTLAVLEHVKDPFQSAKEIQRILKPGGVLYAVVPFLQPRHGYPNHYFNMTAEGLHALFEATIEPHLSTVPHSGLPIWTLNWFIRSWAQGLEDDEVRERFFDLRLRDLVVDPQSFLTRDFVRQLPEDKNFELASTTMLLGVKRGCPDA